MSQSSNQELWLSIAESAYPEKSMGTLLSLKITAAGHWYNGCQTELSNLFEKYLVIKTLKQTDEV